MTNRLPEKLTALRKHFGYSQGDLATKLQVPVAEYMNWENGNSICRIEQLRYLASLYRVPIEDLASNVRSVTLPRLDEDDDSIDIAFGANGTIPSMSETLPLTAEIDLADNLISPGVINTEPVSYETGPVKTDDEDDNTLEFQETVVNQIVDDSAEIPRPKKESRRPEPQSYEEAEEEPARDRSRMYLFGGLAAGALVLVLAVMYLFGGSRSRTSVDISNVNRLALGGTYSMYLSSEGKLVTMGQNIPALDSKDLVQVSAATSYAMGLKKNGTVVCSSSGNVGKVDDWKDIVMIAAGENHSVGLKKDGTVECNGSTGACSVSDWKDVAAVYAGNEITIGVTSKGTALVSGSFSSADKIRQMKNISSVDLGSSQIAITGSDGSVTCLPIGNSSASNTAAWTNISSAAAGGSFAAGLSGGKVTVATTDDEMVRTVSEWSGIQYIAARNNTLIAVNSKGNIIGAGDNSMQVYGENDAEPEPEETEAPEATKLSQPSNLRFTVTSANLQLNWDSVNGADYYTVVVNSTPETSLKTEKPSASISTDKLRSGSTYIVTITACAKDNTKMKNSDALIQQYAFEANLTKLASPSGITVNQEGETIQISWNPVSNAEYYEVTIEDMSQNVSQPYISVDLSGRPDGNFTVYVTAYPRESDTRYTFSDTSSANGTYTAVKKELSQAKIVSAVPGKSNTWTLTWNYVDNAANYTIALNGTAQTVTENFVTIVGLPDGEYVIQITANPKDISKYSPSVSSDKWTYTSLREETPGPVFPDPTQEPEPDPEDEEGESQEGGPRG